MTTVILVLVLGGLAVLAVHTVRLGKGAAKDPGHFAEEHGFRFRDELPVDQAPRWMAHFAYRGVSEINDVVDGRYEAGRFLAATLLTPAGGPNGPTIARFVVATAVDDPDLPEMYILPNDSDGLMRMGGQLALSSNDVCVLDASAYLGDRARNFVVLVRDVDSALAYLAEHSILGVLARPDVAVAIMPGWLVLNHRLSPTHDEGGEPPDRGKELMTAIKLARSITMAIAALHRNEAAWKQRV